MWSRQVQSHLMHCLVIGFDFAIDPGFEFDFELDFAVRAAHQNDLLRRVPEQMQSHLAQASFAWK